mmetsp:Transcript_10539/g.23358  ORF Transcript_10539/g.23358 Transcript_10539/m.23358 type:complete len:228 (-) Transcript_10539:535-1218(-)
MIHWYGRAEEPLHERIMKIDANDRIHPHLLEKFGHIRSSNRFPLEHTSPILPTVTIVRYYNTNTLGRSSSQCTNSEQQLHNGIGRCGGTDHKHLLPPNRFFNLHTRLPISKCSDTKGVQTSPQKVCHLLPKTFTRWQGKETEFVTHELVYLGRLVKVHFLRVYLILAEVVGTDGVNSFENDLLVVIFIRGCGWCKSILAAVGCCQEIDSVVIICFLPIIGSISISVE